MANTETAEPTPSTSKAVEFTEDEIATVMAKGKRHYVCQETMLAVGCFADACNMSSTKYGQTASECAEPYLCYGKALLDLARMENDVLGNALGQGPELEEDNDEDLPNQAHHIGEECKKEKDETSEEKQEKGEEVDKEEKEKKEEQDETKKKEDEEDDAGEDAEEDEDDNSDENEDDNDENAEVAENEEADEEEKGEEVSNMQLAWEMLELAKVIAARQDTKDSKLRQAEAAKALGEISLELEHYPEAIGDLSESLRLQNELLEADDRRLAEANYNIALAFSFDRQFDKSVSHFNNAIEVIQKRIKSLEDRIAKQQQEGGKQKASENVDNLHKEVKELQELIPEMKAKIEDAEEMRKTSEAELAQMKQFATEALGGSSGFDAPTQEGEAKPIAVSNIGHLVRKKRKPEEEEKSQIDSKKAKQADEDHKTSVNGNSCNGH